MKYKVLFMPKIGAMFEYEKKFNTAAEAEIALDAIADYTLMLHECGLMPDYSNMGAIYKYIGGGEWVEIDGDGLEI